MKTQRLGKTDWQVGRLAYGCMRISGTWERSHLDDALVQKGIQIIETAFEAGYRVFDLADIYGGTTCESIFGEVLRLHPSWRAQIIIVTKCGIRFEDEPAGAPHRYDVSYAHILSSVDGSLSRLGVDNLDVLLLHRPDYLADPDEIARAFTKLRTEGKVREFGVSNFRPSLLAAIQQKLSFSLVANQIEIHPEHLDAFTDGTLDQCMERQITPMAWRPLAGGKVATGVVADHGDARLGPLHFALDAAASNYGTDRSNIVLAWLMRHPAGIMPVIGTCNLERIRSMARAPEIELDHEHWYSILRAARGQKLA